MTIAAADVFGMLYDTGFLPIADPYVPPDPPVAFRSTIPSDSPMPSDFYLNVPVGSGMTYVSTSDPMHTTLVGLVANWNYNNWTDPVYKVVDTDPLSSGIEHREVLPSGFATVNNTSTMSGTPGKLIKKYTSPDLRVPAGARWESSANADSTKWGSDRKVMLDFQYDITLTTTTYASDGTTVLSTVNTFYPAGTLRIECHKWQRVTSSTVIWTTNLSKQNLVTGENAYNEGAVASGIYLGGYVREWEVAAALAGDPYAIKHALRVGLPNGNLKLGQVWPARTQDAPSPPYVGTIPYGTHFVLPPSFDVNAATADPLSRACLWALKLYGAYVLIRAGSTGVISFGIEPRGVGFSLSSGQITTLKNATTAALDSARISANSNLVAGSGAGTYNSVTRAPNRGVIDIAGGGTRITAGMGLDGYDNTTGLLLPFDPDPAAWV